MNDLSSLWALLDKRKMDRQSLSPVPRFGAIVTVNDEPVAIGFIRVAEGGVGLWDGLITDPDFAPNVRHEALDELTIYLVRRVKDAGIRKIIAWTEDAHTLERAKKIGFRSNPATLMVAHF